MNTTTKTAKRWVCGMVTGTIPSQMDMDDFAAYTCEQSFPSEQARSQHQAEAHAGQTPAAEQPARALPEPDEHQVATEVVPETTGGGTPTGTAASGPTDKQLAFIASLAEQKGVEASEPTTKQMASVEIKRLQALPDPDGTPNFRRNRFDSPCTECGNMVPAGEGVLRKDDGGNWLVGHTDGCPAEPHTMPEVPDGAYAVEADAGNLSFYRVKAGNKPGVWFVDQRIGDGWKPVPWKNREAVMAKIAVDPRTAAERYGRELGICGICHRTLTNETSRSRGLGPVCAEKVGW